ncbi:hypothetical protein [Rossellomorea vietnamensis]|uniref:hypothetical protein n=1 Tax=Rossellomorea vietnamensis TaxID=218284 RepID=UPI000AE61C42|nr:hypothetical protein [Rossellomorea vietnamensis]
MNALQQLKAITENQKSISTSRLAPLLREIELMYIGQGKRIAKQRKELNLLQITKKRTE